MEVKKLKECCTIIAGQSPESKYYNSNGDGLPFFQGKADFGELYPSIRVYCSQPTKIAEKDDILLSVRAPVGPTNLAPCKVCIGRGLTAIRPSEVLLTRYVLLFFRYFEAQLASKGTGTTFKAITQDVVKNLEIPIPPLPEQERIVARIEELFSQLDAGVETLKKTKAQLAVYRQAVLKEAFEGRLTIHVPVNLPLSWESSDETNTLPAIPEEWHYIALKYLGDLGRGKSKHRPRNDPKLFVDGKYPFIQTGDVKAATNCITSFTKQYGEFGLSQSKLWPKGTLCITIAANIAETAFLGIDACFPDSIVGFTPNESILAEYVRYFVESQKIRLWAFAPATAQKNINLDTLENLIVPYCSIDEQRVVISEIESRLSVCDSIEQTVDTALQQAEAMRQSILKGAFEGKL
jgi:type I site-specific deoxyribonuclease